MPFDKVESQIDFPALEREILQFWQQTNAFDRLRRKNHGKPRWSFLDGPITANNPMGVHHAWGRTYKDLFQRYFAMIGYDQRYQNGFDCQGLWVEVEVEKELGLKSKRDIENLVPGDRFVSIDHFVQLCKQRVDKFARIQTEQSIRLGMWMDWDREADWARPPDQRRSYFTMSEENNYTIWRFLKKCHERRLVYRGYDSMPWCPRCAVGISQMEMHEGYQLVAHQAVFVRFPLRGRAGENLLIWTTTPWTLTSNVAAAVNPELTYLKIKHRDLVYYVAKGALTAHRLEEEFKRKQWVAGVPKLKTLEQVFKEKGGYEVLAELSGKDMIGWTYDGPFDDLPAQAHPGGYPEEVAAAGHDRAWASDKAARDIHRVIAWKDVGEAEGTGIVHIAPGCGAEDFHLGQEERLVAVAPLDEYGAFITGFGPLAGKSAIDASTTEWIFNNLKQKDLLLHVERYPHNYPHCWRCKTELLFRLVDEWYINMSWRDEIMQATRQVTFLPASINGLERELDWLRNMGDWMISKKRFWGLALPIWVDEQTGDFEVIGSLQELHERAVEGWSQFEGHSPHRPWIDVVKIRNPKTGNLMARIPDVGNPWLDAGIVPYSTMGYNRDRRHWEEWFPADFITESFPGQFRNWFYAILAMSTMMEGRAPMKVLLGHALVRDEKGEEMHKSKGNAIPFDEAADKMSADLMRWMFCRHNPASNINFGYGPAEEIRNKFILKLWNTYAFFCNYARLDEFDPAAPPVPMKDRPDIDRWILSDLQKLIQSARQAFEGFNVMAFCLKAEEFVDDKLSNWYVRRNRRRFWKSEQGPDKLAAYQTLHTVLTTVTKLIAPVMPFLAEVMHRNLASSPRAGGKENEDSVHLCDFPRPDESLMDNDLSADMEALLRLVSLGSAARNAVKIKVRQPLAEMRVQPADERDQRAVSRFADQIMEELNIKKISLHDASTGRLLRTSARLNMAVAGQKFGPRLAEVQAGLAAQDQARLFDRLGVDVAPYELATASGVITLEPADVAFTHTAPEGWSGLWHRGTAVAVDARLTDELRGEGMARDIVRQVQELRKKGGLQPEDRIVLFLGTDSPKLRRADEAHRSYICGETLAVTLSPTPLGEGAHRVNVKIDGEPLTIELRKAS
jgi:isoleucyl-tRNA synthetase